MSIRHAVVVAAVWLVPMYVLTFAAVGHTPDVSVFRPFYRSQFPHGYTLDLNHPQTFSASTAELAATIESVAALPEVTDGNVDTDGFLSFSLSVVKNGTPKVFEAVIDTTTTGSGL